MTMIISAHLGDCILIAADKRAMTCDLETGTLQISHDDEAKIKLWCRGAIAGTGVSELIDNISQYFINISEEESQVKQMDAIYEQIEKIIMEGIPKKYILNNVIVLSIFDGIETLLFTIPLKPFFQVIEKKDVEIIQPYMNEIKAWEVDVCCYNIPPDMSFLQEFQRNLNPMSYFKTHQEFLNYYIHDLKKIFATHASFDTSITTSFDLYIQSVETGSGIALHIENKVMPMPNWL